MADIEVTVNKLPGRVLDTRVWGTGITDIRHLSTNIMTDTEIAAQVEQLKVSYGRYGPSVRVKPAVTAFTKESATESLRLTIEKAQPGVIFLANPWREAYAKWLCTAYQFGFKPVSRSTCSINWVMCNHHTYKWKGKQYSPKPEAPWASQDGFGSWEHVLYFVKEPVPQLKFEFTDRITVDRARNYISGDNELTPWHVNYGGRVADRHENPRWENQYARLSKNCGVSMGLGAPVCGRDLTQEFLTISAYPEGTKMPKGFSTFLEIGGMRFGHNLRLLLAGESAKKCDHDYKSF
jgi:hypothetical protein